MSYHTGTSQSSRSTAGPVLYRNIENLWANCFDWVDGINFSGRAAYICTNPENYADDTSTNYTAAGVTLPSSNGFIKTIGNSTAFPWAFLPNSQGGSSTTYIPDRVLSDTGWRALFVGGYFYTYDSYGLFCFYASYAASEAYGNLGARPLV